MAARYHHTQRGTVILVALLIALVSTASAAYFNPVSFLRWLLAGLAGCLAVLAWVFSTLTVDVDDQDLRWHFGSGLWSYRIAREDIEGVQVVRNSWWQGFGIRMKPGFRLYNVSGLDAVELRLKTGDIRRIGSDDAQRLADSLNA
jgi:hypothetical protein